MWPIGDKNAQFMGYIKISLPQLVHKKFTLQLAYAQTGKPVHSLWNRKVFYSENSQFGAGGH